jgi:hypothetical protein
MIIGSLNSLHASMEREQQQHELLIRESIRDTKKTIRAKVQNC